MTPEREKEFWESMKLCFRPSDNGGKGKCVDPDRHNHGCAACPVADGLYAPPAFDEEASA